MALPAFSEQFQPADNKAARNKYLVPFILVTSLFFLWGLAHNLNSTLIPHLKKACQLNNRQSTLIDTSVFLAYFLMAIPAGMLIKRWGYKNGIITGLTLFAIGAFLFIPAADGRIYELFLLALFIIGCGLAVLETAANPYAAVLGNPSGATFRLNLAASFNGLAVIVAPLIGVGFIFSGIKHTDAQLNAMSTVERLTYFNSEAASVKMPYMILGIVLVLVAIMFYFFKLPEIKSVSDGKPSSGSILSAFRHKQLKWAVIAQFFYVGAQVCVTSFFILMAEQVVGMDEKTAGIYLSAYGILFMSGRFVGTILIKFMPSAKLLTTYAIISIFLSFIAIIGQGMVVLYALGGLGFFMSIMFPTIFSLGIAGLGEDTKPGSSLLVMSIVGGAIIPYIMGTIIDISHDNIQLGYIVPLVCFLPVVYYGWMRRNYAEA